MIQGSDELYSICVDLNSGVTLTGTQRNVHAASENSGSVKNHKIIESSELLNCAFTLWHAGRRAVYTIGPHATERIEQ